MKTTIFLTAAMVAANAIMTARADGFMDADTERARHNEANGECEINGQLGADKQACVSAYYCANWGGCAGDGMPPIEQPALVGGVYMDNVGGGNNGN